jgi:LPS sulfotransferase NodH
MSDYFEAPQPAIIIAQSRSGSTFLSHCLDSHYDIGCERDGPFGPHRYWQKLGASHRELARALWCRGGYRVSMFKVTARQVKNGFITPEMLKEVRPKVINLHRENILKALVSATLSTAAYHGEIDHPLQTYETVPQREVALDCTMLVDEIEAYRAKLDKMRQLLAGLGLEVLDLSYEQLTGGKEVEQLPIDITRTICEFLGVAVMPLYARLKKLNPAPIITNRDEIEATLKDTPYRWML